MNNSTTFDMTTLNETLPIFRYKLMPETINELNQFAKIHRFDTRDDFKEAWEEWIDINDEIIENEEERLNKIGYKGDVKDKMYKSVRYYYRKKPLSKQEPIKRRKYYTLGKNLLSAMDAHINKNYKKNGDYSPALGYDMFCNEYIDLLREEITLMSELGNLDPKSISDKMKKTYKNRYFRVSRNMTIVTSDSDNDE